jgi:hypothetical protein
VALNAGVALYAANVVDSMKAALNGRAPRSNPARPAHAQSAAA